MRKLHCLVSAAATTFAVSANAQPFSSVMGSWGYGGYGAFHAVLWVIILIALILGIIWRVWAAKHGQQWHVISGAMSALAAKSGHSVCVS
jgi:uncharacterized membrane protein